jgi:hypothetical protein
LSDQACVLGTADRLETGVRVKLSQYVLDVIIHGRSTDVELPGNGCGGLAFG